MILNSVHTSITSFEHRTWHLFQLELQVLSSCENTKLGAVLSTNIWKTLALKSLEHATWVLKGLLSVLDIFSIYSFKIWFQPKLQKPAVLIGLSKNRRFCQKILKKERIHGGNFHFCWKDENPNLRRFWAGWIGMTSVWLSREIKPNCCK